MSARFLDVVPLFDRHAPRRIVTAKRSATTAQALDRPGILLEAGGYASGSRGSLRTVVEVDDVTLAHHFLARNTGRHPWTFELKEQHGYKRVTVAPGAAWLNPAGQPMSLRVRGTERHAYCRVSIDPARFDRLVSVGEHDAAPVGLRRTLGISGPQVRHLLGAAVAEASGGTPSGIAFVETLMTALCLQLVQQAGMSIAHRERERGGLAPRLRRRVLERMDAQPDAHLTIDELAREAGLSPAHFARAFKQSLGRAPHQHLVALRLERARRLLDEPNAVLSDIALRTGFADQAHFSRFFKRQFGVTPGAVLRARRR